MKDGIQQKQTKGTKQAHERGLRHSRSQTKFERKDAESQRRRDVRKRGANVSPCVSIFRPISQSQGFGFQPVRGIPEENFSRRTGIRINARTQGRKAGGSGLFLAKDAKDAKKRERIPRSSWNVPHTVFREEARRAGASGGNSSVYRGGNPASTELNRRKPRYTELMGFVIFVRSEGHMISEIGARSGARKGLDRASEDEEEHESRLRLGLKLRLRGREKSREEKGGGICGGWIYYGHDELK